MRHTQLQLLKSLGVTVWHRQPSGADTGADTPLALLVIAPSITDFMMHQTLFLKILSAMNIDAQQWQVVHEPSHFEQSPSSLHVWVIGDAGACEDKLPAQTIYSPLLETLSHDRHAKQRLWQQLKQITHAR